LAKGEKMAKTIGGNKISKVVTSSIMGHSGGGMFPLTLHPSYRRLTQVIKKADVYNLTKSSTAQRNIGNFILYNPMTWKYIQKIGDNGLLNAYGLTNNGVIENAPAIARAQKKSGFKVIPNFYPQFSEGRMVATVATLCAISTYQSFLGDNFWAIELNYSCPNAKEKIEENINNALACSKDIKQRFPKLIQIAKISYVHPIEFAQELVKAGVDVIHGINTIPYDMVYKNGRPSPLADVGGGAVSGRPTSYLAFKRNYLLRKKINAEIIMGCGITRLDDARKYFEVAGADIISICTLARLNPKEAEKIIEFYS
jgi:dihydroorotate dehydrogenase (NAD+) catalytic subunit